MQNPEILDELRKQLAPTISTTVVEAKSVISITDPIKIKFNCKKYFLTLQALENVLAKQYNEETELKRKSINEPLRKFIYLAQVYLNVFCIQSTFNPDNIAYSCFELGIFYFTLLQIAEKNQFTYFISRFKPFQELLFQAENCNKQALVIVDVNLFQLAYYQEINQFAEQFNLFYHASIKGKVSYITEVKPNDRLIIYNRLMNKISDSTISYFQQQLLIKLLQFNFLDPICIKTITRTIIMQYLHNVNDSQSEKVKTDELLKACEEYHRCLARELSNRFYEFIESVSYFRVGLLISDFSHMSLGLIAFYKIHFKQVKLPKQIKYCTFAGCVFAEDNFKNTEFDRCVFMNCDFTKTIIHGSLSNCLFLNCIFKNVLLEYLDISYSDFGSCYFENTEWYRVNAAQVIISQSRIHKAAITFSNLDDAKFKEVTLNQVLFDGSRMRMNTRGCNWEETNLNEALYLTQWTDAEHDPHNLRANLNEKLLRLFSVPASYLNLLTYSSEITSKLNYFIYDENIDHNSKYYFRYFLGWILCATDRLELYCEQYEQQQDTLFSRTFAEFEILFETLKIAVKVLKSHLTLYDKCHLTLITQGILRNGLFSNYQQYQNTLNTVLSNNLFAENEKTDIKDTIFSPDQYIFKKRESLLLIQQLPERIRKIDDVMKEMQGVIAEDPLAHFDRPALR